MRREFERVVGDRDITYDDVRELRYCGAVFNETLRLYPPVAADFRICQETCTMPSGLVVQAGTQVTVLNAAIGRDPKLWSDPDAFKPERWLDPEHPDAPVRRVDEYMCEGIPLSVAAWD